MPAVLFVPTGGEGFGAFGDGVDAGDFYRGGVADREEGDEADAVQDVADAVGEPAFGAGGHFLVAVDDGHVAREIGDVGVGGEGPAVFEEAFAHSECDGEGAVGPEVGFGDRSAGHFIERVGVDGVGFWAVGEAEEEARGGDADVSSGFVSADFFPHGEIGGRLPAAGVGKFIEGGVAGDFGGAAGDEGDAGFVDEGGDFGEEADVFGDLFEGVISDDECEGFDAGDFGLFDDDLVHAGLRDGGLRIEVGVEFILGDIEEADFEIGVGVEAGGEELDAAPGGFDGLEGGVAEDGAESGGEGILDEFDEVGLIGIGGGNFIPGDEIGDEGVDVGSAGVFRGDGLRHEAFEIGAGLSAPFGAALAPALGFFSPVILRTTAAAVLKVLGFWRSERSLRRAWKASIFPRRASGLKSSMVLNSRLTAESAETGSWM